MLSNNIQLIEILKRGGTGVIPTDTLYGISVLALSEEAVEKVYKIKKRAPEKPMIILISDIADLGLFNVGISNETKNVLSKVWPGKVSILLFCSDSKFKYLRRGTGALAFRLPNKLDLQNLIKITGPLISTTVNLEGRPPAVTISEARNYFSDLVDVYIDAGKLESQHSTLIKITGGKVNVLRQGEFDLSDLKIDKTF